jgi:hypothetical protein
MSKVLIHIGYHKTATTWLQQNLFVAESSVFKPISDTPTGISTISSYFFKNEDRYFHSAFDFEADPRITEYMNNFDFEGKVGVISNERLCGSPYFAGADSYTIMKRIYSAFPNAKIFISIREQRSYILSLYFEYLNNFGTLSIDEFLSTAYFPR